MHLNRNLNIPMPVWCLDVNYNRRSNSQIKLIINLRRHYEDIDEAFYRKLARVHRQRLTRIAWYRNGFIRGTWETFTSSHARFELQKPLRLCKASLFQVSERVCYIHALTRKIEKKRMNLLFRHYYTARN